LARPVLWWQKFKVSAMAKKRRGRPRTGVGVPISVRLQPAMLRKLDAYRAKAAITRPEALRRLADMALSCKNSKST
jgi:Ribbon-helix-helix protein, copG family